MGIYQTLSEVYNLCSHVYICIQQCLLSCIEVALVSHVCVKIKYEANCGRLKYIMVFEHDSKLIHTGE